MNGSGLSDCCCDDGGGGGIVPADTSRLYRLLSTPQVMAFNAPTAVNFDFANGSFGTDITWVAPNAIHLNADGIYAFNYSLQWVWTVAPAVGALGVCTTGFSVGGDTARTVAFDPTDHHPITTGTTSQENARTLFIPTGSVFHVIAFHTDGAAPAGTVSLGLSVLEVTRIA